MRPRLKLDELPTSIRLAVNRLMGTLANAQTREQIKHEGAVELGFVLGLETAQYLRASDIEALYVMFEEAVQARLQALGDA